MSGQGISIIIPVLNEARGIVRSLEGLQDFRRTGAEIIVVDNASSDDDVAASWVYSKGKTRYWNGDKYSGEWNCNATATFMGEPA